MEKIAVSKVIEFKRKKTPGARATLIHKLKYPKPKKKDDEEGGDYWTHSISAVGNAFKEATNDLILEKIHILEDKQDAAPKRQTKIMFQKNLDILHRFEDFDFSQLRPLEELTYLKKPKDKSILVISDLPVQMLPKHVFIYEKDGVKSVGACWFVAKIKEYTIEELAIFSDSLYRYLVSNYHDDYEISSDYCLVVDAMTLNVLRYADIQHKAKPSQLEATLAAMQSMF